MFVDKVRYYFHILKFGDLLNFGDWQVLIWGISGHVPLSMRIMAHFILANGYQNTIFAKFNSLQNFPLYGKLVINVCVYACTCTCTCIYKVFQSVCKQNLSLYSILIDWITLIILSKS